MIQRLLAYLVFAMLMTISMAGSTVVVVLFYLPMVALKAVWQAVAAKAKLRTATDAAAGKPSGQAGARS